MLVKGIPNSNLDESILCFPLAATSVQAVATVDQVPAYVSRQVLQPLLKRLCFRSLLSSQQVSGTTCGLPARACKGMPKTCLRLECDGKG